MRLKQKYSLWDDGVLILRNADRAVVEGVLARGYGLPSESVRLMLDQADGSSLAFEYAGITIMRQTESSIA